MILSRPSVSLSLSLSLPLPSRPEPEVRRKGTATCTARGTAGDIARSTLRDARGNAQGSTCKRYSEATTGIARLCDKYNNKCSDERRDTYSNPRTAARTKARGTKVAAESRRHTLARAVCETPGNSQIIFIMLAICSLPEAECKKFAGAPPRTPSLM